MTATRFGDDRRVRFQSKYALALMGFVCRENFRYYLNGIHCEPHPTAPGVLLVATDGHMLAVIHDETGETNGDWICHFPARLAAACKVKAGKHGFGAADVHFIGRVGYVTTTEFRPQDGEPWNDPAAIGEMHLATEYTPPIDGTFPDWRKVWPDIEETGARSLAFNSTLLKAFTDAAKVLSHGDACVTLVPGKEALPSVVRISSAPEFGGLIMPIRDGFSFNSNPKAAVPDFVRGNTQAAA